MLFLPIDIVWGVILEFIKTGKASSKIQWIAPDSIPKSGNW